MSQKFVLASVGTAQFFDQTSGDLIVSSKTWVDSGINFSVTAEEIRGGNWIFQPPPIFSNEYGVVLLLTSKIPLMAGNS